MFVGKGYFLKSPFLHTSLKIDIQAYSAWGGKVILEVLSYVLLWTGKLFVHRHVTKWFMSYIFKDPYHCILPYALGTLNHFLLVIFHKEYHELKPFFHTRTKRFHGMDTSTFHFCSSNGDDFRGHLGTSGISQHSCWLPVLTQRLIRKW